MRPTTTAIFVACLLTGCAPAPRQTPAASAVQTPRASDTERVVGVRVMTVEVPPQSPLTSSEGIISRDMPGAPADEFVPFVAADRDTLLQSVMAANHAQVHANLRLVVEPDQRAEATIDEADHAFSVDVRLVPSAPGSVEAWIGYREGDRYALKPTWIRFDEGQAIVIKVPGREAADGERSLVITIDRPGDEAGFGC